MTDAAWFDQLCPHCLGNGVSTWTTYTMARYCIEHGIPGDMVECGVYRGVHVAAMARALMDLQETERRVHLFDSFQGLPEPGPNDGEIRDITDCRGDVLHYDGVLRPIGLYACDLQEVRENMNTWGIDPDLLIYHPGWFQETLNDSAIRQIALLRLDGDLYESTLVCLRYLYPKLSLQGWCVVDDYAFSGCRQAVHEYMGGFIKAPVSWQRQQ